MPGTANSIWLTDEQRVDRDQAAFFNGTWDITSKLQLNGGLRYFKYNNSLQGFYGFSQNYDNLSGFSTGMASCFAPPMVAYTPCTNLNKAVIDHGTVPRVNLTYKITPDALVYATYSEGFRPGGVNRHSGGGHWPVPGGLPQELRNRLEDPVAGKSRAIQRRAVLGKLAGLPVLLPGPQQPDHHRERAEMRASRVSRTKSNSSRPPRLPSVPISLSWMRDSPRTTAVPWG